ncbi:galactokinase [Mycolicibacterium rutilum]|uniref:Galactokinase n=1 Tax=Mycolicibacterium rutilum TaxID=370526 RepID=A0A1H6LYL7_MYCRU|nr:galactokinase [Mycolicibacterium rutilum]SEH91554.1 galactokinase [Mycolicibacterium rutilum]
MTMSGSANVVRFAAPGRVNLIGEHTDYNAGFALPIALPERTAVAFQPADTDEMVVCSDRADAPVRFPLDTKPCAVTGWAAYVAGIVWALQHAGHPVPGGTMSISGGVAMGSGLASSAALACAALGALLCATGRQIDRIEQARIACRAENEYVGAPTGLMDQLAILFAESRRAQLIDFDHLTTRSVAFDPDAHGVALLLINSQSAHQHAAGEYAARRASCERAAAALGVSSLRDVQGRGVAALRAVSDPEDLRRARHVITENRRVLDTVAALDERDFDEVGRLLNASHASMRDDFEITTAHIDLIAETAVGAGALGARMTGGGFGGCVIALVLADEVQAVEAAVREQLHKTGYPEPAIAHIRAGVGPGRRRGPGLR